MTTTIVIERRFCGPPDSGNGGYVCGLIAGYLDLPVEVTLRQPPPLMTPLRLTVANGQATLTDGETLIATARPGTVEFTAPPPPAFREAEAAAGRYLGFSGAHPFPTCFVCGPERAAGDGLHIFAGRLDGRPVFASPWIPDASLADEAGLVRPEFIWAALDCPGAFAIMGDTARTIVLGRLTVAIAKPVRAGETGIVVAWTKGSERRKHFSGTAVYDEAGELCAVGDAVWIDIGS